MGTIEGVGHGKSKSKPGNTFVVGIGLAIYGHCRAEECNADSGIPEMFE